MSDRYGTKKCNVDGWSAVTDLGAQITISLLDEQAQAICDALNALDERKHDPTKSKAAQNLLAQARLNAEASQKLADDLETAGFRASPLMAVPSFPRREGRSDIQRAARQLSEAARLLREQPGGWSAAVIG